MTVERYLITTSDYYPQIGGLSTFCSNIEKSLTRNNIPYDVFHWQTFRCFKSLQTEKYSMMIHIHPWASFYLSLFKKRMIPYVNFYHGSEILFCGSSQFKTLIKKIIRPYVIQKFEQAKNNVFISEFTFNKLLESGFRPNYSKDLVFHNTIEQVASYFIDLKINDRITFICVARDVPHKNLDGCVHFCENLKKMLPHLQVELRITSSRFKSELVEIIDISASTDDQVKHHYRESHFNLLLTHDHSKLGYYEGFGLTCLEAASYGVPSIVSSHGGLPENVHHGLNGLVLPDSSDFKTFPFSLFDNADTYSKLRQSTFSHNQDSHAETTLDRLWRIV